MTFTTKNHIISVAHRGYSGKYKGNTFTAFKKAYDRNFDMIQIDLQICKTGELIIYEDIMYQKKLISEMKYYEVEKKIKHILTFKNFLKSFPYKTKGLVINLKGDNKVAYNLYAFLKTWRIDYSTMIVFSFNINHLDFLKDKLPHLKRGLITKNILNNAILEYLFKNISYICIHYSALDEETVKKCSDNNIFVFSYTSDSIEQFNYMKKYNVDGIISNYKILCYQ
jgi:glycerophosphoryl diester phosphodiesterase